mmetsp:Transcript_8740/g.11090  ORF Transcript_8740/g.11090 Transcript_8740/m.11090 type:complete len:144 (+) Transcript_8740:79-510(+)
MMEALGLVKFNPDKLKPYLKMAVHRFEILNNKKTNLIKQEKRTIAQLLADEKEEKARIKVEHVIRQDFTIEAYEILELLCDLVHERMRLLVAEKECVHIRHLRHTFFFDCYRNTPDHLTFLGRGWGAGVLMTCGRRSAHFYGP